MDSKTSVFMPPGAKTGGARATAQEFVKEAPGKEFAAFKLHCLMSFREKVREVVSEAGKLGECSSIIALARFDYGPLMRAVLSLKTETPTDKATAAELAGAIDSILSHFTGTCFHPHVANGGSKAGVREELASLRKSIAAFQSAE